MVTTTYEKVRAGVALLNTHDPEWFTRVSPDRIDMSDGDKCVLGQVYGHYAQGAKALGIRYGDAYLYGFNYDLHRPSTRVFQLEAMHREWYREVVERQANHYAGPDNEAADFYQENRT